MITIQDVFLKFYPRYTEKYTPSAEQAKAAHDIMQCKTADLGGHVEECEDCGHIKVYYNSCRNRHCPSCQGIKKEVWIDKRSQDILNAPYFHVVFTMPRLLHALIYQNQKLLYPLMYKALSQTLLELSQDEKYLGAQIGFFSLLHTWGQDLHYHPHIHTVVLAGGLTTLNQWRRTGRRFFIPVKVLSKKFRGKFLYFLKEYYQQDQLKFYGDAKKYQNPKCFQNLIDRCYAQNWYSYTQRTLDGPIAVINYLGRYTHQIAIANSRIVSVDDNTVSFTVKDYKDRNKKKVLTLKGIEFIRRFLMHVLPKRFVKIRHYGLLANRNRKTKLVLCKRLSRSPSYKTKFEGLKTVEILSQLVGRDMTLCPTCRKGKMKEILYFGASP